MRIYGNKNIRNGTIKCKEAALESETDIRVRVRIASQSRSVPLPIWEWQCVSVWGVPCPYCAPVRTRRGSSRCARARARARCSSNCAPARAIQRVRNAMSIENQVRRSASLTRHHVQLYLYINSVLVNNLRVNDVHLLTYI